MTHRMVAQTHDLQAIIRRIAGSHCRFRRFLTANPQLLLLGAALLRHSHLLVVQSQYLTHSTVSTGSTDKLQVLVKDMDQLDVIMPQLVAQFPQMIAIMQSMRTHDAYHAQHHVRHLRPDGRIEPERHRHGAGVRRRQERRFLLSAAGGVREPGLQARDEFLPVSGRESGSIHHFASAATLRRPRA